MRKGKIAAYALSYIVLMYAIFTISIHPPKNKEKQVEETYLFGLVTGLVKNYYEDGKPLSESFYRGNRQHGPYTSYYPNGQIKE